MAFTYTGLRIAVLTLVTALLTAAAAEAAPPPGMRWGDHSGLSPSAPRHSRVISSGRTVVGPTLGTTYSPQWGRPLVWRYQSHPPVIVRPVSPSTVIAPPVVYPLHTVPGR